MSAHRRQPAPGGPVRAGRDEREACVDALQEQYAAGRLGDDELNDRVQVALTATTRADLEALTDDLPSSRRHSRGPRPNRPWLIALVAALALGGAVSIGGVFSSATPPPGPSQSVCESTGEMTGPDAGCPELSDLQQQIIADADRADRAAMQLAELADRNPDQQLTGLVERARVSAQRAQDATLTAQQLVLVTDGDPSEKLMAEIAKTSGQAVDAAQKAVDEALSQFGNK